MILPPRAVPLSDDRVWDVLLDVPDGCPPEGGWPVAYVLDIRQFHVMRAAAGAAGLPGVLVGLGPQQPADRVWDYTPRLAGRPPAPAGASGRAQGLLRVLEGEVRALVRGAAPIDAQRQVLCGHSLAALFALYVLGHHPEAFQGYALSSPSVWWGNGYARRLLRRRLPHLAGAAMPAMGVHLTVGEYEQGLGPEDRDASPEERASRLARREARRMVEGARALGDDLAGVPGLRVRCRVLPGLAHGSVSAASLLPGWRWLLD